ncbi:hypothetical protein [Phreatobacter sp.]|uniref:hypothetical protein n=1 Tax=Phreatobacter sp. TaxID=1966341 RepID=UPI003F6E600A
MSAADRARRYRERRREGIEVYRVPVRDCIAVVLVELGELHPNKSDDRAAVEAALARFLERLALVDLHET